MKEHAYFCDSCSVLVRENQQNFCSCSGFVLEHEQVREHVLEQLAGSLIPNGGCNLSFIAKNVKVASNN